MRVLFFSLLLFNLTPVKAGTEYLDPYYFACSKDAAEYYRLTAYDAESLYHGSIKTFYMSGKKHEEAFYNHGIREGKWSWWYDNGQLAEEGQYDADDYYIQNSWTPEGKQMVVKGFGMHTEVYFKGKTIRSEGVYHGGVKDSTWITRHENGRLAISAEMLNGDEVIVPEAFDKDGKALVENGYGHYTSYYKDGVVETTGQYLNKRREGKWIWYYRNGRKSDECYYVNGKRHGSRKSWNMNGLLRFEGGYKEGFLNGICTWRYPNGAMRKLSEYTYGKEALKMSWGKKGEVMVKDGEGYYEHYYYTGTLESSGFYKKGEPSGAWTWFFFNGKKQSEGFYEEELFIMQNAWLESGVKTVAAGTGSYSEFYNSGILYVKGEYIDGLRRGDWIWNYKNGSVKNAVSYKRILPAAAITYYPDGKPEYKRSIVGDSIWEHWWYRDGSLKQELYMLDNISYLMTYSLENKPSCIQNGFGLYESFYDNKMLKTKGRYKNGQKDGEWESWYESGKLHFVMYYIQGEMEGIITEYNEQGVKIYEAAVLHGDKNGEASWWYDTGVLKHTGTYADDEPHGIHLEYDENGTLTKRSRYITGVLQ